MQGKQSLDQYTDKYTLNKENWKEVKNCLKWLFLSALPIGRHQAHSRREGRLRNLILVKITSFWNCTIGVKFIQGCRHNDTLAKKQKHLKGNHPRRSEGSAEHHLARSWRQWTPPACRKFILLLLIHTLPWPHLSFIHFSCNPVVLLFCDSMLVFFPSFWEPHYDTETWPVKRLRITVWWTLCCLQSEVILISLSLSRSVPPSPLFVWYILLLITPLYNTVCPWPVVITLAWLLFTKWAAHIKRYEVFSHCWSNLCLSVCVCCTRFAQVGHYWGIACPHSYSNVTWI